MVMDMGYWIQDTSFWKMVNGKHVAIMQQNVANLRHVGKPYVLPIISYMLTLS